MADTSAYLCLPSASAAALGLSKCPYARGKLFLLILNAGYSRPHFGDF